MNQPFLVFAAPDLLAAIALWRRHLEAERRLAAKTVEAYDRDVGQFLMFLTGHLGEPPKIVDLAELRAADFRAFMAARRLTGAGARTLARGLAGIRSLLKFLERQGLANAAGAAAVRAPKQNRSLPRPLDVKSARAVTDADMHFGEPWIALRDAAVMTLLYGCGLRISEALSLNRGEAPTAKRDALRITGKGGKTRIVPVLPVARRAVEAYLAACPYGATA
ncbi:MAG TPA: site-specific integrase, partial [Kaistiaceae bacterium]|nr:site-specific integrase [Kaistiaceae bacterium]